MRKKIKIWGRTFLSLLLATLASMSLCASAFAAGPDTRDEYGFLELKVYPYIGGTAEGNREATPKTISFMANIHMLQDPETGAPSIIPQDSVAGFDIEANFVSSKGASYPVRVWAEYQYRNTPYIEATYKKESAGTKNDKIAKTLVPVDQTKDGLTLYVYASCPATGDSTELSIDIKRYYKAIHQVAFMRVGMQVRGFQTGDGKQVAFGAYDYFDNQAAKVENGHGISDFTAFKDSPEVLDAGPGTGDTGQMYQECYFPIPTTTDEISEDGVRILSGIKDMAQLNEDLRKWVLGAAEANPSIVLGKSVELWGPGIIRAGGAPEHWGRPDQNYCCAYYTPGCTPGPDDFIRSYTNGTGQWPGGTQQDFVELRMMRLVVPINVNPEITVNYIDIDTGEIIDKDVYTDETGGRIEPNASNGNTLKSFLHGSDSALNAGYMSVMQDDYDLAGLRQIMAALRSIARDDAVISDPATIINLAPFFKVNAIARRLVLDTSKSGLYDAIDKYAEARNEAVEALVADDYMGYLLARKNIGKKAIADYKFEYAYGHDSLSTMGQGLILMSPSTPQAAVMVSSMEPDCTVNMYYRCDKTVDYYIKAKIDGVIDESKTQTKQTIVGDVIEEDEVDTSFIPKGWVIKDIENVPMKVSKDPSQNIIVVDCESGKDGYTVQIMIDGSIDDDLTKKYEAPVGTVVEDDDVNLDFLPEGIKVKDIEGTPLVVDDDPTKNIITVVCESERGEYTIKVKVNGTIRNELTRKVPARVGAVIRDGDIDTSFIPSGVRVNAIQNTPLTVSKNSSQNIIIIDCQSITPTTGRYQVLHYKDGVLTDMTTHDVPIGTIVDISDVQLRNYPGYIFDNATGVPLTVSGQNGVIRVYYKQDLSGTTTPVSSRAALYKDAYLTAVTEHKSGYGVWGTFIVDVSTYADIVTDVEWSVPYECGTIDKEKRNVPVYTNFAVSATATYTEGLDQGGNQIRRTVTVPLVKDTASSTPTKWVFHFPTHYGSNQNLPKAYIPINWADGTNWTVSFNAVITCTKYTWSTETKETVCPYWHDEYDWFDNQTCPTADCQKNPETGEKFCPGKHSYYLPTGDVYECDITYEELTESWDDHTIHESSTASIKIIGNMYEDDFTGDRD